MNRSTRSAGLLQPQTHWWHRFKLSTQKFAVVLSVAAVAAGFGYVFLTNHTAAEGFAIKSLEKEIAQIQKNNQKLELQAADLRSLSAVDQTSVALGLVPTDSFEYVAPTSGAVAVR